MPSALSPELSAYADSGRFIEAGGHRVFMIERGRGPVLLLVHGFPTSGYDYRAVMAKLEKRFRCIAFDFPGYGLSDKPTAYSYSLFQQADALEALMRALGIERASVACHDMGTSVLCELLARQDGGRLGFALDRVTFTNGSMLMWKATITPFQKLLSSNETLLKAMAVCARFPDGYVRGLQGIMTRPESVSADDARMMHALLVHDDGHLRLPAIAGYMRERYVHKERWIGALTRNAQRSALVWAVDDPIANIDMGRELHALLPAARYTELDRVGHFLIFEDPDRVAEAIASHTLSQP